MKKNKKGSFYETPCTILFVSTGAVSCYPA